MAGVSTSGFESNGCDQSLLQHITQEDWQPPKPVEAEDGAARVADLIANTTFSETEMATLNAAKAVALLGFLKACSPFLSGLIRRDPHRWLRVLQSPPQAHMDHVLDDLRQRTAEASATREGLQQIAECAREAKAEAALLIACADICNQWNLEQVTGALSALADCTLQCGINLLFRIAVADGQWLPAPGDDGAPLLPTLD